MVTAVTLNGIVSVLQIGTTKYTLLSTHVRAHWIVLFQWNSHPDCFQCRVKRPLLARVPSLARVFDNLTEITRVKERVVEFFLLKLSTLLCDVVQLV